MTVISIIYAPAKLTLLFYRLFTLIAILAFSCPCLFPQGNKVFGNAKLGKPSSENQGNPDFPESLRIIF
jgi:hypothetical protein